MIEADKKSSTEGLRLIDSHCHLHDTEFFTDNREQFYKETVEANIGMICVGTDQRRHDTKDGWGDVKTLLENKTENSPIVAIGEIGLDYYYNNSPREMQIEGLEAQLQMAIDYNLPVSFHVRDGAKDQPSVWGDFWPIFDNFPGLRGVLHSFTDTRENLEKGFSRNLYVGLNGISTFTKDQLQKELFASIPLERLLLETDAPFLTPAPFRGNINKPEYVRLVAEYWAKQRNIDFDVLSQATLHNTKELFGI